MNLKGKLARLTSAGPGSRPAPTIVAHSPAESISNACSSPTERSHSFSLPFSAPTADAERMARITELRARLHAMMARPPRSLAPREPVASRVVFEEALPFERRETPEGLLFVRAKTYECSQRHGSVPLHSAIEARGDALATLALDASLACFEPARALYLDTETTGLSGGTGILPFLVGLGRFEGRRLRVEQILLPEPCYERAMLARIGEQIESASALVTFNGKAFDLPLLRARFVMARLPPPREPPHLDLLHLARRVYGPRVEGCRLTTLEREVLGFARMDDVPSGQIPARYAHYLRSGDTAPLVGVAEHNLWDVIAMAALLGELAARASGGDAAGRFEPEDMAAMARTALRAGAPLLAGALAEDAAREGARKGRHEVAARANTLAARVQSRRGDHHATHRCLLEALALAPEDPEVHLALAKLYEHKLRDPERALQHAERAHGAENAGKIARRIARLAERVRRQTLRLPGIE